jgi:hypothetical protein
MNKPALSPVLATVCLTTISFASVNYAVAMDTDLQIGPSDSRISAELVNQHYDQGVVRNDNVTVVGRADFRFWDIGLHGDYYAALNSNRDAKPDQITAGESTQINLGVDYLFEIENLLQIIPHYNFTMYPNWDKQAYKADQHWVGVDVWYLLPIQGMEIGVNMDYNPMYHSRDNENKASGGTHGHDLRSAIAMRQFVQNAPLDLQFYQVLNMANGTFKRHFYGMDDEGGLTTLDLGMNYITPFFLNEFWVTARLEGHFWLEHDDREILRQAGANTTEIVMAIGFEWKPSSN